MLAAILLLLAACIPASSRETDTDTVEAKDEFEAAVEADPAEQFPLFGPFSKHPVPVLETRVNHSWFCPWHQQQVLWESKDVFNPAVVVTGSPPSIKVLSRALPATAACVTWHLSHPRLAASLCSQLHDVQTGTIRCTLK